MSIYTHLIYVEKVFLQLIFFFQFYRAKLKRYFSVAVKVSESERSIADLPFDVITDVLIHLPVKSLLRFRLVSKRFRAVIDSHGFVKQHLNHSFKTKTNHNLILNHSHLSCVDLYSPDQPLEELHHPLKPKEILGSVNGLLCLFNGEEDVVIWNLATRRYQRVAANEIEYPLVLHDVFIDCINYGFGYDLVSDDYKLIRMVLFYSRMESDSDAEFDYDCLNTEAKVYSLRSKSWQRIQSFPYYFHYRRGPGVLACGALHWIVSRMYRSDIALIAAFDLTTNKFRIIDQPEFPEQGVHKNVWELGGCLCLTCLYVNDHVDLWVMRNYGEKDSWSKLFSVSQPKDVCSFNFVTPLAYSKMGNEIMLVQDYRQLLYYDLEEERVIDVYGFPGYFDSAICVGSLVPLSGKAEEYAINRGRKKRRGKKRFGEE